MSRRPVDIKDKQVLDLVAGGESNGDYNAVYGIRVGSSQQPDFSRMTISEVRQYQRQRIASGQPSSAVGRYQFIQSTLDETTQRAGFNPDTTYFTPQVQDQLMTTRLDQRGLSKWKNGNLSNNGFQDNLAKEFASVPVATAQQGAHKFLQPGDGYYDGDGINSASHVDATKFSNSLNQINNESGTRFVNGDVDTGESADANTGDWTPPPVPYKSLMSPSQENSLAERAANGDQSASDELYLSYKESLKQYMKDNNTDNPYNADVADEMFKNESSDSAEDRAKAEAFNRAADELVNEGFIPNPDREAGTQFEVDDGTVINPLEDRNNETISSSNNKKLSMVEPNWYTSVDLPTYKWTFYITNREVFDAPENHLQNDKMLDPSKATIIAQSGVEGTYTVDNFLFNSILFGDETKGSAQTSTIQFELREPMGFTLLDAILSKAKDYNFKVMKDATYVLKLEFLGRNRETGRTEKYDGIHYFPVVPYQVTSETGPDGTSYIFTCLSIPSTAVVENSANVSEVHVNGVSTLEQLVNKLESNLNRAESLAVNPLPSSSSNENYTNEAFGTGANTTYEPRVEPRKTWEIKFADSATITGPDDYESAAYGNTGFDLRKILLKDSNSSGEATEITDVETVSTKVSVNTNVATWLKDFITKQDAFNEFVKNQQETEITTPVIDINTYTKGTEGKQDEVDDTTQQKYITTVIEIGIKHMHGVVRSDGKDSENLVNQEYQLKRFDALPIVKKYEYLYTGKNTEVLGYSAQFNNLFSISVDPNLGANTANSTNERRGTNVQQTAFLSDIPVDTSYNDVLSNTPKTINNSSSQTQSRNETTSSQNELIATYARSFANRTADTQVIEVDIIGDPYLIGIPGSILGETSAATLKNVTATSDVFVAFVSYFPSNDIDTAFQKGPMDLYTSGIFELREVEHRFQAGSYTSKIKMYRDHKSSTYILKNRLEDL